MRERGDAIVAEIELRRRATEERDEEKKLPMFSLLLRTIAKKCPSGLIFFFF